MQQTGKRRYLILSIILQENITQLLLGWQDKVPSIYEQH